MENPGAFKGKSGALKWSINDSFHELSNTHPGNFKKVFPGGFKEALNEAFKCLIRELLMH